MMKYKMSDIYVASTLRHLLFSLSKAIDSSEKSYIIYFHDYQNIDPTTLDLSQLPERITLIVANRRELSQKLKSSAFGKLLLAASLRGVNLTYTLKIKLLSEIRKVITDFTPDINNIRLFVFNERNKMARLFRLLVSEYEMIEDGVGNYYEIKVPNSKQLFRLLTLKAPSTWVFGEEAACKKIHVVSPENLPQKVAHKGVKIDFLAKRTSLPIINSVFKYQPKSANNDAAIIATQPTSKKLLPHLKDKKFLYKLNQVIIDHCRSNNINIRMKLHPSESIEDYKVYFPDIEYLPIKLPIELIILNSTSLVDIISINSTAGLGFEKYCSRKKLIPDEKMSDFVEIVTDWENNPKTLENTVAEII